MAMLWEASGKGVRQERKSRMKISSRIYVVFCCAATLLEAAWPG
jgi:hypothetical protein